MVPKAEVLHALQCLYSSAFLTMKAIFKWNNKKKQNKKHIQTLRAGYLHEV